MKSATPSDDSENLRIEARVRRNWHGKTVSATTATVGACIELGLRDRHEAKLYAPVVHRERLHLRLNRRHPKRPFRRQMQRASSCTCCKCTQRIPRILGFALRPNVADPVLERSGWRALVGLFSVGWLTPEFAGLQKRCTPANALPILYTAEMALQRISSMVDPWVDTPRYSAEWVGIMEGDGVRFPDGVRVEWVMRGDVRGTEEGKAGKVCQALVNVLLPHPAPADENVFPAASAEPDEASPRAGRAGEVRFLRFHFLLVIVFAPSLLITICLYPSVLRPPLFYPVLPILLRPSPSPSPLPSPSTRYAFYRPALPSPPSFVSVPPPPSTCHPPSWPIFHRRSAVRYPFSIVHIVSR
ncbi:hypothetical protein B0H11DRAFT_2261785 [Mycena galericulata]|nr:hypothetical protein B0H11DRAFT_2261785 [Mycena galericulata]